MEKPSNEAGDMVKGGEELGEFKQKLELNEEAKANKEKKLSLVKDVFLDWSLRADINAYGKCSTTRTYTYALFGRLYF